MILAFYQQAGAPASEMSIESLLLKLPRTFGIAYEELLKQIDVFGKTGAVERRGKQKTDSEKVEYVVQGTKQSIAGCA